MLLVKVILRLVLRVVGKVVLIFGLVFSVILFWSLEMVLFDWVVWLKFVIVGCFLRSDIVMVCCRLNWVLLVFVGVGLL